MFGALLRRLAGRSGEDPRADAARAALHALREEARALRKEIAGLERQIGRAEHQVAQLIALREDEPHAAEEIERLTPVMDLEEAARHVRQAIAGARRIDSPVPHLVIADLLPSGLYRALLESVPTPLFLSRGRSGFDEMPVPPELAPLPVAAVWTFIARLVRRAMAPALIDAFADLMPALTAAKAPDGRLVRREAGAAAATGVAAPVAALRLVLHLAPDDGGDGQGSQLRDPAGAPAVLIPFAPNTAVAFLDAGGAHDYLPVSAGAAARFSYELAITRRA